MNLDLGDYLTDKRPDLVVKMHQPDMILRVEVRREAIYLSTKTIQGAGGLPVGTAGKAALMLSGGIDSPVAGYYALKRVWTLRWFTFQPAVHQPAGTQQS